MPISNDIITSRRNRLQWAAHTVGLLACLWIALNGFADLWAGLLFSLLGAAVGAWLVPAEAWRWRPWRLFLFILWFLKASWVGGLDVARRALHPALPIQPTIYEHDIALPEGLPQTLFVAVLSLLPGTLSLAMDPGGRRMRIHLLTSDAVPGIRELETRLAMLFALPPRSSD